MAQRTTVIIAHRLSTVRGCDNIIVLNKGSIVESGRHEQLMAMMGNYYNLVVRQTKGSDEAHEKEPVSSVCFKQFNYNRIVIMTIAFFFFPLFDSKITF